MNSIAAATTAQPRDHGAAARLQPVIDLIAATLLEGRDFGDQPVSVTLPGVAGRALIVSVRTAKPIPARGGSSVVRSLDSRQLQLVEGAIRERLAEPLSVSMLSSIAGLSRSYFSHAFRATVGRPPHAHILRLRLERAMTLMADSRASLGQIALDAGFSDQAHFSNAFRRSTGMTPTQWRRARGNA